MIRSLMVIAACFALHALAPTQLRPGNSLGLSDSQYDTSLWYIKWLSTLWAILAVNALLNKYAENKWVWKHVSGEWDWRNEVAVITGGSQGIGACVVKSLVSHGISCAVLDVVPLSDIITPDERKLVRYYRCDITSPDAIRSAAEAIRSDLGSPSILINNAGIGNAYTILDIPFERLERIFQINLLSQWSTVKEFLPDMLAKKKGHIMSVASLASFVSLAAAVDYSCTKSALLSFHEGLGQELKHRYKCPQIKTTIVHPNWTKSAITAHPAIQAGLKGIGAKLLEAEDVAEAMVNQIIAARSGQLILGPGITPKIRALPSWLQEIVRDSQANVVGGSGSTG
ncbi:NAD(P)-binding protein [Setomelanomma holmii]|uniref:Short-chain dehydrogenase/reductase 3 n=1 Tax=Setomelanomma holmii TaxID=210430 RepID=A0A9P4LTE0_9PLEO|nr:NAD(P)-binding protein [Setomelanomma holmii]